MTREIIGERFQAFRRAFRDAVFGFLTQGRVVARSRDGVFNIAKVSSGREGNIKNEPLAPAALGARNADLGKHFELLNVNLLFGGYSHFVEDLTLWEST